MRTKQIFPTVLTAISFLMLWFIVFFVVLYWYLHSFGSIVVQSGLMSDMSFVTTFYFIIAFFLVIFSVWFATRFYEEH